MVRSSNIWIFFGSFFFDFFWFLNSGFNAIYITEPTKKSKSAASRIKAAGIAQSQSKAAKTNQGRAKTVSGTDEEVNDEFNDEDGGINDEISNEDDEIDFLGGQS